jgi:hypothetical protein
MRRIFSLPIVLARLPRSWAWCWVALCLAGPLAGQASREYDLKAVFLFNFVTFVDWPANATPDKSPFVIGVLGEDPFGSALDEVIAGEKIRGAPLQARRCRTLEEARQCQILFISSSEAAKLPEILKDLRGRPVLTVADVPRFLEAGGIIAFSTGARLQLQVNPAAAQRAGLTISSKLLRVAKVVEDAPP